MFGCICSYLIGPYVNMLSMVPVQIKYMAFIAFNFINEFQFVDSYSQ